ncbi:MAG: ABC transporter ATP-binding protein [Oligoflexus sp.]
MSKVSATGGEKKLFPILRNFYQGQGRGVSFMTVFFVFKSLCVWFSPIIMARLIDILRDPSQNFLFWLAWLGGLQVLLVAINFPATMIGMRYQARVTRGVSLRLRSEVCRIINSLNFLQQERLKHGALQAKIIRDIELLEQLPRLFLNQILATFFSLLIIAISISVRAPAALLFFLVLIPVAVFLRYHFLQRLETSSHQYRQSVEDLSIGLQNLMSMHLITRAHGLEQYADQKVSHQIRHLYDRGIQFDINSEKMGASSFVSFTMIQTVFLLGSIYACYQNWITVGDVVMFNAFFASISGSLLGLVGTIPILAQIRDASLSLGEFLDQTEYERQGGHELELAGFSGFIELSHVDFSYPGRTATVCDLSVSLPPGQMIALIGPSGSGKSTLVGLILGLFEPEKGQILVDHHDLKELDLAWYRRQFGLVAQEQTFFLGTILENITYGSQDYSEAELIEALESANAWEFVKDLQHGIHTMIGEQGVQLSGGQKQRLGLARALLRKPRILILDEPTSALDLESEEKIKAALENLRGNTTIILISHKPFLVRDCDYIYLLQHGYITSHGRPDELLEKEPYIKQFLGFHEAEVAFLSRSGKL